MTVPRKVTEALAYLRVNTSSVLLGRESIAAKRALDLLESEILGKYSPHQASTPGLHERVLGALRWVEKHDGSADCQMGDAPAMSVLDVLFRRGLIKVEEGLVAPIFTLTPAGVEELTKASKHFGLTKEEVLATRYLAIGKHGWKEDNLHPEVKPGVNRLLEKGLAARLDGWLRLTSAGMAALASLEQRKRMEQEDDYRGADYDVER